MKHPSLLALLASASLLAAFPARPAATETPLLKAASAMQRQDFEGAIRALKPAMPELAHEPRAWRALGLACLKLHRSDEAELAYKKALSLQAGDASSLFALGLVFGQRGDRSQALNWLRQAAATHRFDMTQMEVEADLAAWVKQPEFQALKPQPADFEHPFVETVEILKEWDGEAAEDQFGWIARGVGDVDGDGVEDFVTSAPTKDIHGANAGRVYVYSGRTGALLWSHDGEPGGQLGSGIEAAGDVDGDGVPDVIASAPGKDTVYVYSGRSGKTLLTLHGEHGGDNFGDHVASVGDIDGDGHADLIVGAPANSATGKAAGRAYVYSGKDGSLLLTLSGKAAGDAFGSTVSGYSKGKEHFMLIGAPGAGIRHAGEVSVYRGLTPHPAFRIEPDSTGMALGYMFVAVLGDVDGDGVADVFASDFSDASLGPSTGKVYVHSGRTGKRIFSFTGSTAGEGFGTTQSIAGDINGDGRADLIVGSWQYSATAQSAGRAYLYDGKSGRLLRTYTSKIAGDTFGFDAVGLALGPKPEDRALLITAAWSAVKGHHSGRIFLIRP